MNVKKLNLFKVTSGVNGVIYLLTVCDIFVWGTVMVATPLLALYLSPKFGAQTVEYVGISTACYYLARGLFQLPIGALTDKIKRDHDEIIILALGCFLMAAPFLLAPLITQPWHYFILEAIGGLGASMNLNTWRKLFSQNVDKEHTGFGYGFYETIMSLATAGIGILSGYLSGINATVFEYVIFCTGLFVISGGLIASGLFLIKRKSFN